MKVRFVTRRHKISEKLRCRAPDTRVIIAHSPVETPIVNMAYRRLFRPTGSLTNLALGYTRGI